MRRSRKRSEGTIDPKDVECDEETLRAWFRDDGTCAPDPDPAVSAALFRVELHPFLSPFVPANETLPGLVEYLSLWKHGLDGCRLRDASFPVGDVPGYEGGFCQVCLSGILRSVMKS